jgi:RND family efflux transporter MFP subunit
MPRSPRPASSLVVLALSASLASMSACHAGADRAARQPPPHPLAVRTAPVERVKGAAASVPGVVRARRRAALSARIPASVVTLPHREGDRVAAGAVVARLDDAALRAAVAAAEAALAAAQADRTRAENLLAKGAATPRERDEATARAAAAAAALEGARDNLSYAALRAPFAGRVAAKPANVGDVVAPGATILELEGEGGYEVVAAVDGALAASLRVGQDIAARVDGQPETLRADVVALSPAGDPATHRFELRADLPSAPGLRSGLFARLLVEAPGSQPRLFVPRAALVERGGLTGVFVVEDGVARLRWIAPGAAQADAIEVRAGLEAGERVALDPASLADGAPVREAL